MIIPEHFNKSQRKIVPLDQHHNKLKLYNFIAKYVKVAHNLFHHNQELNNLM